MAAERVESAIPRLGVRSEPVVDLVERGRIQLMEPLSAVAPDANESGCPKHVEMLRDRLTTHRQPIAEGRDRCRTARAKALEKEPAGRIGDGSEDGFHAGDDMQPIGCMSSGCLSPGWEPSRERARRAGARHRYDATVRLTAWEEERLLIFGAAELARRHRLAGLLLNAPEAVSLICDAMLDAARASGSYADVEAAGAAAVAPDDVIDGVRELVDEVRLEVLLGDGTRLIVLVDPLGRGRPLAPDGPGTIVAGDPDLPLDPRERPHRRLAVRSTSQRTIRVSSHYPFERVNARLQFDRAAAAGFRLDLPAGSFETWRPGETKDVELVAYDGSTGEAVAGR